MIDGAMTTIRSNDDGAIERRWCDDDDTIDRTTMTIRSKNDNTNTNDGAIGNVIRLIGPQLSVTLILDAMVVDRRNNTSPITLLVVVIVVVVVVVVVVVYINIYK